MGTVNGREGCVGGIEPAVVGIRCISRREFDVRAPKPGGQWVVENEGDYESGFDETHYQKRIMLQVRPQMYLVAGSEWNVQKDVGGLTKWEGEKGEGT